MLRYFCLHSGTFHNVLCLSGLLCSNNESMPAEPPFIWKFMQGALKIELKIYQEARITKVMTNRI